GYFLREVVEAHRSGCMGAKRVFEKGGQELAKTIGALSKKINTTNVPIILGGGVFRALGLLPGLKETLYEITKVNSEFRVVQSDPVWGALRWATKVQGINEGITNERITLKTYPA